MTANGGFFGVAIYHPKTEVNVGSLWRTANILGASFFSVIGKRFKKQTSDTLKSWRHVPLTEYKSMEDFKSYLPYGCMVVAIEMIKDATKLSQFVHPKQACYLLGAEDGGIPEKILEQCHYVITLEGEFSMNVAVAGSIVLYHRQHLKS